MGNVTFLGVEGSGKTVLTMSLVNAFKAHQSEGWFLRPETRGAFRFVEQIPHALTLETLPHQTTALKYLAWSILKDGSIVRQMDMLDYPGEIYRLAFLDAKDDLNPEEFKERVLAHQDEIRELLSHLLNSDHVFVLFNLSDARDTASNDRNLDAVWVTNACLDYLYQLPNKPKITLLLTQVDRYVDLDAHEFDAKVYVEHHLSLIANNFPNLDVGAVAALRDLNDGEYGLGTVLRRFLCDVSMIGDVHKRIQKCRQNLEKALLADSIQVDYFARIVDALDQLSVESPKWKKDLPWFVQVEKFVGRDGLINLKDINECKVILRSIQLKFKFRDDNELGKINLFLSNMTLANDEVKWLISTLHFSIRRRIQAKADAIQEKENEKRIVVFCAVLISLFVLFLTCYFVFSLA